MIKEETSNGCMQLARAKTLALPMMCNIEVSERFNRYKIPE